MPTLFRLISRLAVFAVIVYAIMFALIFAVEPKKRDVTIDIPAEQIQPK